MTPSRCTTPDTRAVFASGGYSGTPFFTRLAICTPPPTRMGPAEATSGTDTCGGRASVGIVVSCSISIPPDRGDPSKPTGPSGSIENVPALSRRLLRAACVGASTKTRCGNIDPERTADEVSTTGGGSIGLTGALTLIDFQ